MNGWYVLNPRYAGLPHGMCFRSVSATVRDSENRRALLAGLNQRADQVDQVVNRGGIWMDRREWVLAADTPDTYVRGEEKGRWPGPPFDDLPLVTGTRPTCLVSSRPCRPHQRIVVVHTSKKLGSFPSSQVRAASLHCATWLKEPSWHVVVDGADRSGSFVAARARARAFWCAPEDWTSSLAAALWGQFPQ
jgi:hypothetical protein